MPAAVARSLESLSRVYRAEIERFAEELRPLFERGELRGDREEDADHYERDVLDGVEEAKRYVSPRAVLEDLCAERFARSVPTAGVTLAASPSASDVVEREGFGVTIIGAAAMAAANDVLSIARERRWYTPTEDETP
jgi:hypothetical protein